jgi:DNA replication regulator SLD3
MSKVDLPLYYLDLTASWMGNGELPRLFSTHVEALETTTSKAYGANEPTILIARLKEDAVLYVVEKVRKGKYALCKIGQWVQLRELMRNALVSTTESQNWVGLRSRANSASSDEGFGRVEPQHNGLEPKRKRLDFWEKRRRTSGAEEMRTFMMKKPAAVVESDESCPPPSQNDLDSMQSLTKEESLEDIPDQLSEPTLPGQSQPEILLSESSMPIEPAIEEPTPFESLETLRIQYLEALYMSKVSLAYFAKSALSRARARFEGSAFELTEFLKTLVFSAKTMDKKYREVVTKLVEEYPAAAFSEDEREALKAIAPSNKKSKKLKVVKRRKDGTFPKEDTYIRAWWISGAKGSDINPTESRVEITKRRMKDLKVREMELQVVIILEIIALESSTRSADQLNTIGGEQKMETKPKSTKANDPSQALDVLVDRLCISQALGDEFGVGSLLGDGSTGNQEKTTTVMKKPDTDELRGFFVNVVMTL